MLEAIQEALRQSWVNVQDSLAVFIPRLLALVVLLVAGWVLGAIAAWLTRRLARLLRLGTLAERLGAASMLERAELPPPDQVLGSLAFWLVFVFFLLAGAGGLGIQGMETLLAEFVLTVPRIVIAILILVIGLQVATFAWRATLLTAVNAKLPSARLLGATVRLLIVLLVLAMALEEIGVARTIVLTAFAIAFGAIMLGVAIAMGIGGGQIAKRLLERQFPETRPREEDPISHV
jgi:hypothetical protein